MVDQLGGPPRLEQIVGAFIELVHELSEVGRASGRAEQRLTQIAGLLQDLLASFDQTFMIDAVEPGEEQLVDPGEKTLQGAVIHGIARFWVQQRPLVGLPPDKRDLVAA